MSNLSIAKSKSTSALMPTTTALRHPPVKFVDDQQRRVSAEEMKKTTKDAPFRPYLIPTLNTTSESTSLPPDSMSSSSPPSPYIVNHKRRGATLLKSLSQTDVAVAPEVDLVAVGSYSDLQLRVEERCATPISVDSNSSRDENDIKPDDTVPVLDIKFAKNPLYVDVPENELVQGDDLLDFHESASVASCITEATDDGNELQRLSKPPSTHLGEFYDAYEDFQYIHLPLAHWKRVNLEISSEVNTLPSIQSMEAELREMRLNLLTEVDKRKHAEESICNIQNQWWRLSNQLSLVGLTLPAIKTVLPDGNSIEFDVNTKEDLQQQVTIARFVAGCIGKGLTRAEVELKVESKIEMKNFEIARLCDRVQYYEAANHEMSQRNQEAIEKARQRRIRRKRIQKWIWISIGITIAVGTTTAMSSYLQVSTTSPFSEAKCAAESKP